MTRDRSSPPGPSGYEVSRVSKAAVVASGPAAEEIVDLKDPIVAAILAWLIPGLGHIYQGRTAKGVLFMVCILSTFFYGLFISDGRAVYASWSRERPAAALFVPVGRRPAGRCRPWCKPTWCAAARRRCWAA